MVVGLGCVVMALVKWAVCSSWQKAAHASDQSGNTCRIDVQRFP
ncbi:hypothetical protein VCRA2119O430_270058 [Vibrio crassostreae]|nr:hypothetical protein VCRA2113O416_250060 [Vibrio crassostreae]CAK1951066.1 hypothetical protein VCRA2119O430_270058 [Vibrio crassostreae]CAK1958314.1 hypothetical protein VCRA2119O431_280056 [Vibrio crassostreae]CAK3391425.1 hypothetical protein VCRA2127O449_270018 [Vibrio crassostreae]CAK3401668.1 hypothetical protein VCRA2120O433_260060 [Vibrio crassostreae]